MLGVETNALKPLSQTPTPYGVASVKDVLPLGFVLTAFLFSTSSYVSKVYRVLSWHEGSVEESPQSTNFTTF